jgi:hypothetical protein
MAKKKKPELNIETKEKEKQRTTVDYFHLQESLYRKEIDDWHEARLARHSVFTPSTYAIQQLYKDAMLDNHLSGAIETRILKVLNRDFILTSPQGDADEELSAVIQTRWFRHLVRKALESTFYGYSLVYVDNLAEDNRVIRDINRENVIPEQGKILKNPLSIKGDGITYTDFPNYLLYIQLQPTSYGLLERIAPLTIYKRHSWATWDEFEQIFGLPIRIARTAISTDQHMNELQQWLENMGTAAYAIFNRADEVEIKESSRSDAYHVYLEKINAINREISKGILGQTMTMDDGSSQSQAIVHSQVLEDIIESDVKLVQDWINDNLLPVLRYHGIAIPEGYYVTLQANTQLDPKDKITIDSVLLANGYNLDTDYIEATYGSVLDKTTPRREQQQQALSNDFF